MKKFFGISMICVFTTLLFITFTYADWPPEADVIEGYAKITDSSSYVFGSDNGSQYIDIHILDSLGNPLGREKAELAFNDNALSGFLLYLGKPEKRSVPVSPLGDPVSGYYSSRKAKFLFDILNSGKTTLQYKNYKAALDVLVWQDATKKIRRGSQISRNKYYLNDNSICLGIRRWFDSASQRFVHDIVFTVENSTDPKLGCGDKAVTQTVVDNFYSNDKDWDYRDAVDAGTNDVGGCALIVYHLLYDSDFAINNLPGTSQWTITGGGTAHLGVVLESTGYFVPLADYANLPFGVTVSTDSLSSGSGAPSSFRTATSLWGEIKSR